MLSAANLRPLNRAVVNFVGDDLAQNPPVFHLVETYSHISHLHLKHPPPTLALESVLICSNVTSAQWKGQLCPQQVLNLHAKLKTFTGGEGKSFIPMDYKKERGE